MCYSDQDYLQQAENLYILDTRKGNELMECVVNYFQEGGPIGLIENGDIINVDVANKRIDVQLTDQEMDRRKKNYIPPPYKANRGILYKVCENLVLQPSFPCYDWYINRNISSSLCAVHQERAAGFKGMRD